MLLKIVCMTFLVAIVLFIIISVRKYKINNKNKISFKESMDLTELPIVTFYSKDFKLNLLLDTGSNASYINKSLLPKIDYDPVLGKETDYMGADGNKILCKCCNINIIYKDKEYNEEFNIVDLDNAFSTIKKESGVQIHGILGNKFFEKYKYVIDFSELVAYMK